MSKQAKLVYESEESLIDSTQSKKLKQLKQKLKNCQKEKEEYLTYAQRARADLVNFRRRQEENTKNLKQYVQIELIRSLLPVLDSLNQAGQNKDIQPINQQLMTILKSWDLKEIKTEGENFNHGLHEAIQQIKSDKPTNSIVEEVQKGYFFKDQVLRPSKVKIAK